jgi:hypothetical protein
VNALHLGEATSERTTVTNDFKSRVDQTQFGSDGNCAAACLASYFGCTLAELPDVGEIAKAGGDWWKAIADVCMSRGVRIIHAWASWFPAPPKGLHIAGGQSTRGLDHVVLVEDGRMVHDPHPSRAGLLEIEDYWLMIPLAVEVGAVLQPAQTSGNGQ